MTEALTELLRNADVAHVAVDMDALCAYWPWTAGDPHNRRAGLETLRVMCRTARHRGIHRLVLAEVIEQPADVARYVEAADETETETKVVRLVVPDDLITERLSTRQRDGDSARELGRSRELAELMEQSSVGDIVVVNDRAAIETAHDVLRAVGWFA